MDQPVTIDLPAGGAIHADLAVPDRAFAVVAFAHGSGSSRRSPRNRMVAGVLREHGLATMLMDLLTPAEERYDLATGRHRFDIPLLAERLELAVGWLADRPATAELPVGLVGASTGAAAALVAAARLGMRVGAVVSRGGRPDLAGAAPPDVEAPTLLIVGSLDSAVLELNRAALAQLRCSRELRVIHDAGHLFEEPGKLAEVAELAAEWFTRYLSTPRHSSPGN